jgi:D-3-phosphoglycerate dehydrogenase
MANVLIAPATLVGIEGEYLDILRNAGFTIQYPRAKGLLTEDDLLSELKGVSAVMAGSEPYTRRVLESHPQLRVIARAGVGWDAVDVAACNDHGVAVTITPGTNQDAVAEHTFALILGAAKNVVQAHIGTQQGKWPRGATLPLRGRTLGVAGLGRIGKEVALRGFAFKMKVIAYDPFPDHAFAKKHNIPFVSFEQLLAESDFLSLHIPLTPESKHVINKKTLAQMKPTAYLVNTARGGLVCEKDVLEALQNKKLGGAALDVFEQEPAPPCPLFNLPNVVITPHAAGVDLQSREDMAVSASKSIAALSKGQWPGEAVVNPEIRERYKW